MTSSNSIGCSAKSFEFIEHSIDKFGEKLGIHTFGLDKVIPWSNGSVGSVGSVGTDSCFVFSGGLLYDIAQDNFDPSLKDIDLFFYGSIESKIATVNKLLDNLVNNQYQYFFGINNSILYIFIQGIPRIIQLIMTNKIYPSEIIGSFDMTHVMSYYDGNKIYCTPETIMNFGNKTTQLISNKNPSRIYKYLEKGLKLEHELLINNNFILNSYHSRKWYKDNKLKEYYNQTNNMTNYPNSCKIYDFYTQQMHDDVMNFFCTNLGISIKQTKIVNVNDVNNPFIFDNFEKYIDEMNQRRRHTNCKHNNINNILNPDKELDEILTKNNEYTVCGELQKCFDKNKSNIFSLPLEIDWEKINFPHSLHQIGKLKSIYIPCEFIKIDRTNIDVVSISWKITHKEIIDFFVEMTSMSIAKIYGSYGYDIYLSDKIYKLSECNCKFPYNINELEFTPSTLTINNKIVKSYEKFFNSNCWNQIDNFVEGKHVYCMFDIVLNITRTNLRDDIDAENIEVKLIPKHIYEIPEI
jgi:hypothetical protein